jgi:Ni,Fe-hydrogenase III small subunit/NAD-dependent dihydropyrimidine dehydrogenase PreA subunit
MIFDIVRKSVTARSVLIPVEELLGSAVGSRMPEIQSSKLTPEIAARITDACPTSALSVAKSGGTTLLTLDYGECTGCGRCFEAGSGAVVDARTLFACGVPRTQLVRRWNAETGEEFASECATVTEAASEIRKILGRALNIRQVDAGSCNGCEAEITALQNPYYDLERFGMHFVASPKHADLLLVTGPVTRNMKEALEQAYAATPSPKIVVAVGACGVSGGIFAGSHAVYGSVDSVIPVDAYIPGCPPTPAMLLTGILNVLRGTRPSQM